MLARASAREREIAVRLAIGGSRWRIVRQLLTESMLVAALGAAAGLLLARWLSAALVSFVSTSGNRLVVDLAPDWRLFGFVVTISGLACLLFGLSPALSATRTDPARAMQGGRATAEGHRAFGLRRALVVVQVAFSVVLIVAALLFVRSFQNLARVDLGFRPEGLVRASVDLRSSDLPQGALAATIERIVERVTAVPGVERAAHALIVPLTGVGWNERVIIDGETQETFPVFNRVGPTYFDTMDTRVLAGRLFDGRDRLGSPEVAIVNESFARRYFGGRSPVGLEFELEARPGDPVRKYDVVGLVANTKYLELREEAEPIAYFPLAQEKHPDPGIEIIVRSGVGLAALTPALTRAILEVAPAAAVRYRPLTSYLHDSLATERVMASLSGFFGGLSILIASIGLYGVVSYMVARRHTEIGIRMALGADARAVVGMVMRESAWLLAFGCAIGLALAAAAARPAAALLFGVNPWDPASFGLGVAVLAIVTATAAWIPAHRAARMSPTAALRE
jgi:predicted permease